MEYLPTESVGEESPIKQKKINRNFVTLFAQYREENEMLSKRQVQPSTTQHKKQTVRPVFRGSSTV